MGIKVKEFNKNFIPELQKPQERRWIQPDRSEIVIDDTHAAMSLDAFNTLQEYTEHWHWQRWIGKMSRYKGQLYWYGHHKDENMVSLHFRKILIVT